MPCLHGISHCTNGQWLVVCESEDCQASSKMVRSSDPGRICSDFPRFFRLFSAFFGFPIPGSQSSRASTAAKASTIPSWWRPLPALSFHVRETEFSFLAELDVGERHFEPIAGKTFEEAKKNAAIAALQALKLETSAKDQPSLSSLKVPRHLRGRFQFDECEDGFKLKFLGPEEANIDRIRQRSHAKLKVINEKEKHFVVTVAGAEKRFMKATYMLPELLAKFPKSKRPKASLVLDWLMPIKHRPNIAVDSFHLKKMMAWMALHLMLVFPCTWYQCIYRTSTVLLESSQHAFWPTLWPGAWEHVSSCRDWGAKRLLQTLLPKIWLSLLVVRQSMSWQVAAEFYKMCSGDTASICKLFVLGCLGFAVLQWPCMSEKTKSCHFFLMQVLERCAQSNLFCHWFCKTLCSQKLHVDRSHCSTPYNMFILNIKT